MNFGRFSAHVTSRVNNVGEMAPMYVAMKRSLTGVQITPSRLETLLELALRTSTANVDPFKDDLR